MFLPLKNSPAAKCRRGKRKYLKAEDFKKKFFALSPLRSEKPSRAGSRLFYNFVGALVKRTSGIKLRKGSLADIFLPRSLAAAQMPFGKISFQSRLNPDVKSFIDFYKSFGNVFMYGRYLIERYRSNLIHRIISNKYRRFRLYRLLFSV